MSLAAMQERIRKHANEFWDKFTENFTEKLSTKIVLNPPMIVWDSISASSSQLRLQFDDFSGHMDLILVESDKERVNWLKEGF